MHVCMYVCIYIYIYIYIYDAAKCEKLVMRSAEAAPFQAVCFADECVYKVAGVHKGGFSKGGFSN